MVSDTDFAAVAEIAEANGDAEGQDPRYVRHLEGIGRFLIAEESGAVAGYCATHQVGTATMLSDLFISPERQGAGVGRRLLAAAFEGAGQRFTFASQDPRALPLYVRQGMVPRWPLLYLAGSALPAAPRGLDCRIVAPLEAAEAEFGITGQDRKADYAFWGNGLIVRKGTAAVAAGAVGPGQLIHLVTAEHGDPVGALIAALHVVPGGPRLEVCMPGPHPALGELLGSGWRVADFDHHMSSSDDVLDPTSVLSPSLA